MFETHLMAVNDTILEDHLKECELKQTGKKTFHKSPLSNSSDLFNNNKMIVKLIN